MYMHNHTIFICFIFLLALLTQAGCESGIASSQFSGRVISIADGDTITVLTADNRQVKIRLYGIDCPESRQAFGNRARQTTSDAVSGKEVTVQPIETDKHGRTVGIVSISGDYNLDTLLVREGMAWVYPQFCKREKVCKPLRELEKTAKSEKRGLWADKEPIPPWEWRRAHRQ